MVKPIHLLLLLLLFISARNTGSANAQEQEQKTWCVAKPSSDETVLRENIVYACSQVYCKVIEDGWSCSLPNTLMSHASVVMNLYYQSKGRNSSDCNFGHSGLIVLTDPSYGSCIYP